MEKKDQSSSSTRVSEVNPLTEHEVRVEKVKKMEASGKSPWPAYKPVTATAAEAVAAFEANLSAAEDAEHRNAEHHNAESQKTVSLAGRLISRREHGKTVFGHIQDRSGSIQIYVRKDNIGDDAFESLQKEFDVGDIVWVSGVIFKTRMGEITIRVSEITLLSKCLHPLPEKFHGLVDVEQRYRQRYLDLISNPESRTRFEKRSKIVQSVRSYLLEKDFLEVETPMLHPIPGGATARPFMTHHNAYDIELFLRIAPELYLKRLVVGGFERVFEVNRNFRNEGVSTKHNPEFTMVEFYMAYADYKDGMVMTEEMVSRAVQENFDSLIIPFAGGPAPGDKTLNFQTPFKRLTIEESLVEIGGLSKAQISREKIDSLCQDLESSASYGKKLFYLFEEQVESKIVQPTFITGYPVEVSPLAKRDPNNPDVTSRFELFIAGMELANGFTELNDPFDQAERFKGQVSSRKAGDEEAHHYDADYIHALEYGLPPTVGVGMGIDRLTMLLTNTTSIKDVILFPTMKPIQAHDE